MCRTVRPSARGAFTLVELLIVLALFGVVLGALIKVLVGQQRFYGSAEAMVETQGSIRDAVQVLAGELRGISPVHGDIVDMSATSIEFWKPVGASVVCQRSAGAAAFGIPPAHLQAGNALTTWSSVPRQGDRVLVYDLGVADVATDDAWVEFALTADVTRHADCPLATGFTTAASEVHAGWEVRVDRALDQAPARRIAQGASVRFLRRVRYRLYRAGDRRWYLGYQECPGGACTTIQPVSGPYLPAGARGGSGLSFSYYTSAGVTTSTPAAVARIDVTARAATCAVLAVLGVGRTTHVDSLRTSIAVRN